MRNKKHFLFFCKYIVLIACALIFVFACQEDHESLELPCKDFRPVIMIHGFLASGDTYTNQLLRFSSNGCTADKIYVFDWNTLGEDDNAALLDAYIDEILIRHGAEQVDLAGHSAGGGLSWEYISDSARVAKIAHYVHLGSFSTEPVPEAAVDLPIMNIYSTDDTVVEGADIDSVANVKQDIYDHYQVATNAETFAEMYRFFRDGEEPETTAILESENIVISGKALTLGENQPEVDAIIEVYELDGATGNRTGTTPDFNFTADADGHWGPFTAKANTHYEFFIIPTDPAARHLHYYREPFVCSNPLVYLRTFPPPGSLAGALLSIIPADDNQAVVAAFTSSQAVVFERDNLSVNDIVLSSEDLASADQSTIAFFLFDDGDGITSETKNPLLGGFPFLNGADFYFPTENQATIQLNFNDRILNVPAWQSATEGVNVVVFD